MEIFSDYAYYYNVFYADKDYENEACIVNGLLKRFGKDIKTVINFGCGTGRHDIELQKLGYICTGIDVSSSMIEIAKGNSLKEEMSIPFSVADIRNFEPEKKYDAVISLFHVMSYQTRNIDILSAFRTARKALPIGGVLLFDVWYGAGVLSDKPNVRVKRIENSQYEMIRIAKPIMYADKNICDVCYEILIINKETGNVQKIEEIHEMRYFFTPEIELLLQQAGFCLVQNIDCNTLGKVDYNSWTCFFVAKAQ